MSAKASDDPLVGKWFHSFVLEGGITKRVQYQGKVLARIPNTSVYLLVFYEWLMGEETDQVLYTLEQLIGFTFYDTSADMHYAWDTKWKFVSDRLTKEKENA